eukprot:4791881-Alexandrium_andersonii.AAC.1
MAPLAWATSNPPRGGQPRTASPRRWARAVPPPSQGRGRPEGNCPSDSRTPWTSRGGTPAAGPQGRGPSTSRTTRGGRRCTLAP